MQKLQFLNKKQVKPIILMLKRQFGFDKELDYYFLLSEKNKIYLINRAISEVDLSILRISSVGLYFAELRDDELRLSIEGSQLIGPFAKKNVLEIDKGQLKSWLKGEDIEINHDKNKFKGFVIIKQDNDFLGCGRISENKVFNFYPKVRRVNLI